MRNIGMVSVVKVRVDAGHCVPHLLFSASVVPSPGFKCQALMKECVPPPLQSYFDHWMV